MRVTIAGLCFTDAQGAPFSHDWRLVALSYLVAASGSFAALEMAERLRRRDNGQGGWWQTGSAVTLGGSIWSMHLLAMLALQIDLPLSFDVPGTVLSFVIAVAGVAAGLTIARRGRLGWLRLTGAGTLIGFAVASMHYAGMGALLFPGAIAYTPGLWAASLLVAVAAAVAALWLALALRPDRRLRVAAALVMGIAICGMHFTGMTATVFQGDGTRPGASGLSTAPMAVAVTGVTLALLGIALLAAAADRRLADEAARAQAAWDESASAIDATQKQLAVLDQDILRGRQDVELERTIQGLLATVFLLVDAPVAIVVADGRYLMSNPSFDGVLGARAGELVGRKAIETVAAADRARLLQHAKVQEKGVSSFSLTLRLARLDGGAVETVLTSSVPSRPELRRFRIVTLRRIRAAALVDEAAVPDQVVAGKVRLISLDEVRLMLGNDWAALESRVLYAATEIVRAHIGPDDSFRATPDHGFIINFANMSEAEANARSIVIGQELRRHLISLGEDPPTVEVTSLAASVPRQGSEAALDARFAEIERRGPTARSPVSVAGCAFEPVQGCQRGQFVGYVVTSAGPAGGIPGLVPRAIDLQQRILKGVAAQAQKAEFAQSPEQLFVSLPFSAFGTRMEADAVLEGFKSLDPQAMNRLVLLLADIPTGVPQSRIQDVYMRLQPVCQSVGFSLVELESPGFDLGQFKSPIVAVDAADWNKTVPEARVAKLALALHLKRARLLVRRVPSMQVARQMRSAGADFVSTLPERVGLALAS